MKAQAKGGENRWRYVHVSERLIWLASSLLSDTHNFLTTDLL